MHNKTIANWLIGCSAAIVIFAVGGAESALIGLAAWVLIAWVIVAIVRLYK